jgi:hypothetical protein
VNWSRKARPRAYLKVCIGTTEAKCKRRIDPANDYEAEPTKRARRFRCRECHEDQSRRMMRSGDNKALEE